MTYKTKETNGENMKKQIYVGSMAIYNQLHETNSIETFIDCDLKKVISDLISYFNSSLCVNFELHEVEIKNNNFKICIKNKFKLLNCETNEWEDKICYHNDDMPIVYFELEFIDGYCETSKDFWNELIVKTGLMTDDYSNILDCASVAATLQKIDY